MTAFDRFDSRFADALDDLASPQFPDYIDDVLAEATRHAQRPAWTFLERWIPMSAVTRRSILVTPVPWRTVGILLILLAMVIAGAVISIGLNPDLKPAPPFGLAANGQITYASGGDLYTRDFTTGAEELLVGGPEQDVYPQYSRDGLSLAWYRLEPNEALGATLMVANADGSGVRPLFGPLEIDYAAWSPASDSLAVISSAVGGERTLSIVPTGRGEEARAIELPVVPEVGVEWRPPDGRELIFGAAAGGEHAIYGIRPDGSGLRQISRTGTADSFWGPYDITPDGSRMLFTDGQVVNIGILDLDSGEQRVFGVELPAPPDYDGGVEHHGSASILPDGERILFGRYWNQLENEINHQLYVASIDGDGADAVALGPVHRSQSGRNPFWQAIAPDGETIVVVENDTLETWTVQPDGSEREVLDWRELGDPPAWQRVAP